MYDRVYALVLGVVNYGHWDSLRDLPGVAANVTRYKEWLEGEGALVRNEPGIDISCQDICESFEHLARELDEQKERITNQKIGVFIYIAGHGIRQPDSDSVFLAGKGSSDGALSDRISLTELVNRATTLFRDLAHHVLLVFECCYSGEATIGERHNSDYPGMPLTAPRPSEDYVLAAKKHSAVQVLTSSSSSARSYFEDDGSLFTNTFFQILRVADGVVPVDSLVQRIKEATTYYGQICQLKNILQTDGQFILNWNSVAPESVEAQTIDLEDLQISEALVSKRQRISNDSWLDTPHVPFFVGRESVLQEARHQVVDKAVKVLEIVGFGGIGKTTFCTQLCLGVADSAGDESFPGIRSAFESSVYAKLDSARSARELVSFLIRGLGWNISFVDHEPFKARLRQLVHRLADKRCLIVIDNAETIFNLELDDDYAELLGALCSSHHISSVVLTTRTSITQIPQLRMMAVPPAFYSLPLAELDRDESRTILVDHGGVSEDDANALTTIIDACAGNPLLLLLTAARIASIFQGNAADFVSQWSISQMDETQELVDWYLRTADEDEKAIWLWFALCCEPLGLNELGALRLPAASPNLQGILAGLASHVMIQRAGSGKMQIQPYVAERLIEIFLSDVVEQFFRGDLTLLSEFALIRPQAPDHVRRAQINKIAQPLLDRMRAMAVREKKLTELLEQSLAKVKTNEALSNGYATGNLLNLLWLSGHEIEALDLQGCTIRCADFQGKTVRRFDFRNCRFAGCAFSKPFGRSLTCGIAPDGKSFVTGDVSGEVRLWSTQDGESLGLLGQHSNWVRQAHFLDANSVVTCGDDGMLTRWNVKQKKSVWRRENAHRGWVNDFAVSPDGTEIVSTGTDGLVCVWCPTTGEMLATIGEPGQEGVAVACATDYLASVRINQQGVYYLEVWNHGQEYHDLVMSVDLPSHQFFGLGFCGDGQLLVVGINSELHVWQVVEQQRFQPIEITGGTACSLTLSKQGLAAIGLDTGGIEVRQIFGGTINAFLEGHSRRVVAVAMHPDSDLLVSSSEDGCIGIWSPGNEECQRLIYGHGNSIWSVRFGDDGKKILAGCNDGMLRAWNADRNDDGEIRWAPQNGATEEEAHHKQWIQAIAVDCNNTLVATASGDSDIKLWRFADFEFVRTIGEHQDWVVSVDFSPNGKLLVSGGCDHLVILWDVTSREMIRAYRGHSDRVWSVRFSPCGRYVVSAGDDGAILVWDTNTDSINPVRVIARGEKNIWSVAISENGDLVASGGIDGLVKVWEMASGDPVACLDHGRWVATVRFGRGKHSRMLASGGGDSTVRLWSVDDESCINQKKVHEGWVWSIAFDSDGKRLLTGSEDEHVGVWSIPGLEKLARLRPERPYEGSDFRESEGLPEPQVTALKRLGGIF